MARFFKETFNMFQIHESVFNLPIYLGSFAYCDLRDQKYSSLLNPLNCHILYFVPVGGFSR